VEYTQVSLQLAPGDRIYLYSDGVTEAMDKDQNPLGEQALVDCIAAGRGQPLDETVASLLATVEQWCQPNGPLDDVSILGLEWQP
jgi:sigma-B regulation protein RsbU (phosphoserine phosphatase)